METTIKLLVIEDDQEDYLLTKHHLKSIPGLRFSIDWETQYDKAIIRIGEQEHDVYLVDYNLGNSNGVDLVRQAVNSGIIKPFIFLTGMNNPNTDEMALSVGAADFLIKQKITPESLARSIRYSIQQKKVEKELNESNATKNKLFSIISHDLRSPISTLVNSLEVLSEENETIDNELQKEIFKELSKNTKATLNLLENLLNWSRSQIGALHLKSEVINLKDIISEATSLVEVTRRQKNITINVSLDDHLRIKSDINACNLIFRNLLSNALKFTPDNGEINISARAEMKEAIICVQDSGIGMNEITIDKVLRSKNFHTTYGTNNEKGAGLGLKITQDFIKRQGGKLWIESKENEGSRFYFTLPAV